MNKNTDLRHADEALRDKEEIHVLTSGVSMRPLFREHRDIAVIKRANVELKKYDVPLYRRDGCDNFVLHRILKVRENDYVIRGDNTYSLEYVPKDYVIGVLSAFYRNGKYCNCETSKTYKAYILLNRLSYPARFLWKIKIRPILGRIKRKIKNP